MHSIHVNKGGQICTSKTIAGANGDMYSSRLRENDIP